MLPRKPVAPNNRHGRMAEFLSSLESQVLPQARVKSNESPSIVIWKAAGKQVSEGAFGGGYRVTK